MVNSLNSLLTFTTSQQPLIHILVTLLILAGGYLLVKALKVLGRKTLITNKEDVTRKWIEQREEKIELGGNILNLGVIGIALFYLNEGLTTKLLTEVQSYLPKLLTVLLMGTLGVVLIKILTKLAKDFLETTEVKNYIRETGLSVNSIKLLVGAFKAFLYVLLLQVLLGQLNVGGTFITEIINASSWALAFLVAGLIFYGFKDLFQNFAAGIYLKNSRIVRPGEEVKVDEESGEIREVSLFSTTVNTDSGYTVLTPNREIMENNLRFKRAKSDLDTLEEISSYFVAEKVGYSSAASLEMNLEFLGYRKGQEEIIEKMEEQESEEDEEELNEVERMQETVLELTNHEVNTAWIEHEKISDISDELKAWFNDGGLVTFNMNKDLAGGETEKTGFAVATGVEGDEILLVDPEEEGVYYIHKNKLEDAISIEGGGYMVMAPEGTTSYWRIKNDLIYSETRHYEEELSKTLESRLRKIVRQGKIIQTVTPTSILEYIEKWRSDDSAALLWKPSTEGEKNETSEDN